MTNWDTYYKKHSVRQPKPQLLRAITFCMSKDNALDIGAGTLVESKALIEAGFKKVIAIDNSPEAKVFAELLDNTVLDFRTTSFQEFEFPEYSFDLINAQFALPFYGRDGFDIFMKKISDSLGSGGIFVGQLFGVRDAWNAPESSMVFQTKEEALGFFADFEVLEFIEEEKEAPTAAGSLKHWHIFNFIVRKI